MSLHLVFILFLVLIYCNVNKVKSLNIVMILILLNFVFLRFLTLLSTLLLS